MNRCKRLILLCVALWLPVQAAYAVAMPFCRHASALPVQTEAVLVGDHCHDQDAGAMAGLGDGADCDNCEICHLATAGYLPATGQDVVPEVSRILVMSSLPVSSSHIGDPPQQPPRRAN